MAAVTGRADALEAVDLVDARAAVQTAVGGAVVHLVAAVGTVKAVRAEAHVTGVGRVDACSAVEARSIGARLLRRRLAAPPVEAGRARARGVCLPLQ